MSMMDPREMYDRMRYEMDRELRREKGRLRAEMMMSPPPPWPIDDEPKQKSAPKKAAHLNPKLLLTKG